MNHVNEITAAEFEQKILRSPIPVLVDFYADWCGPCRLLAPILQDVAEELNGSVAVYKVDAVENSELAHRLGIAALPTGPRGRPPGRPPEQEAAAGCCPRRLTLRGVPASGSF
jgi:thioredoxin 1